MQAVIIIIMVPLFTPNVHVGYMLKVGSNFCTFGGLLQDVPWTPKLSEVFVHLCLQQYQVGELLQSQR